LFFAIKGEANDGHDYVAAAFEKGAAAAVIDEAHAESLKDAGPLYIARDVLAALENLGRASRARGEARIVAVTGSVGKTGTKEALRLVLSRHGATHASAASYNNHWGVPLTLARMPRDAKFGVFEIGMNHAGEITPLTAMVRPHVAIVTTVAPVHLEYFKSVEAIAEAKAEIFTGLEPGGTAIVNRDIPEFELLHARASASRAGRVLSFGAEQDADARLVECTARGAGSAVVAHILGRELRYHLAAPGRHIAMNSLAVLLAASAVDVDIRSAATALETFEAPAGRGARVPLHAADGPFTLIDESYNANPTSMRAALALLGEGEVPPPGRRVAVLGDMLELGPEAERLHAGLLPEIEANRVDMVFAAGPLMKHLFDELPPRLRGAWAPKSSELLDKLAPSIGAGDLVMVKGSNGSRMGPLVAALKEKFAAPGQTRER
jgi:UDP-N-acetylmuramoyl-tripeptide--D-alanyl-D-alanine ligase